MSRRSPGAMVLALLALAGFPAVAHAHGPTNPVATDYVARIASVPAGVQASVVDGDLRMWLRTSTRHVVVVLDYRGAPYLRFSRAGVAVNENSAMFYLNQTPIAATPPAGLTRSTPASWQRVSSQHSYLWHDGRLHALATVALAPGAAFVGHWTLPLLVDGQRHAITGSLWHRGAPSLVWWWPIAVLLLCVAAALRLRSGTLDARVGRVLAIAELVGIGVASAGRAFHGRPVVSAFGVVEMGVELALVGYALYRVAARGASFLFLFVVAFAGLWQGITLISTLRDGYVLMAVPAFLARSVTVVCLGASLALLLVCLRLAAHGEQDEPARGGDGQPVVEHVA